MAPSSDPEADLKRAGTFALWCGVFGLITLVGSAYITASNLWSSSVPFAPYGYWGWYAGPILGLISWSLGKLVSDRQESNTQQGTTQIAARRPPVTRAEHATKLGHATIAIFVAVGLLAVSIGLIALLELQDS